MIISHTQLKKMASQALKCIIMSNVYFHDRKSKITPMWEIFRPIEVLWQRSGWARHFVWFMDVFVWMFMCVCVHTFPIWTAKFFFIFSSSSIITHTQWCRKAFCFCLSPWWKNRVPRHGFPLQSRRTYSYFLNRLKLRFLKYPKLF